MKNMYLMQLVVSVFLASPNYCAEEVSRPVSVETDYAGDPSDISTEEIILKRSDGSTTFLTKNGSMERVPALSYDNSIIAFLRRVDSNEDGVVDWEDQVELWLMRISNLAESRLAVNLSNPSHASWHPSKMMLTFIATNAEGLRGLYVYDLPSKSLRLLCNDADTWPTWSPKGDYIAFYDNKDRVALFDMENKNVKVLCGPVGNAAALYWVVDNRLLFVREGAGFFIYSPGAEMAEEIDLAKNNVQTVDQKKFGWACENEENK